MPSQGEQFLKELESAFRGVHEKFREELSAIRGNRPSVELIQDIRVSYYDEQLPVKQLGSLSVVPPRSIQITMWDQNAVSPVMKAIESAKAGLSLTNNGNNIIATLSQLGAERREELTKLVKKTSETSRIHIRAKRDETIKRLRDAESKKTISEDEVFKTKEKIQKLVDDVNGKIETLVQNKLKELAE